MIVFIFASCVFNAFGYDVGNEVVLGDVRVQALSPTLIRVEPKGPIGFEDRTTFTVTNRKFEGVPIKVGQNSSEGTTLTTPHYEILIRHASGIAKFTTHENTDVNNARRSPSYPSGAKVSSVEECSELCRKDDSCTAWVYDTAGKLCYPLVAYESTKIASNREFGGTSAGPSFKVISTAGATLYDTQLDENAMKHLLHWPAPLTAESYALMDHPRFFVPEWGTVPIPDGAKVDPALNQTNGYDFRNNVVGDTYVFLLGSDLPGWTRSRSEFLQLSGECPLLPDYAYGTWFTYWHAYTEAEAKDDIKHWEDLKLPLDIWGLDMNWRETDNHKDRFYDHPATKLFPNFTEFFVFLKEHKLRTYFNDHPFPVQDRGAGGGQTSPEESSFRWNGLSKWMGAGLTFWWFDHNWGFSFPPPFVDTKGQTDGNWQGLDNAAWGSHVYYNAVSYFNKVVRPRMGDTFNGGAPMSLTKFGRPDWRPGMDPSGHAESPGQHRYPVWWTGDGVDLQASVESMVDSGLYDLKPFVHSDCGGDIRGSAGNLLRWTAHCAFGSILRFHGSDHRAWTYNNDTVNTVRSYLNLRYKLIPSLIAAGQRATKTGFPLVARGDFYWPEHKESTSNQQYVFLDDVLVAPIFSLFIKSRSVWIPPGEWQDAWDGSVVKGPATITVKQPDERQPMWHRRDGGMMILAHEPASRVEAQDWSTLIIEAFPSSSAVNTSRTVFERQTGAHTPVTLATDGKGTVRLFVGGSLEQSARAWVVRVHLRPFEHATSASVDGKSVDVEGLHLQPVASLQYFPLQGAGSAPAEKAGPVVELHLPATIKSRFVEMQVAKSEDAIVI
eukprot:TRINITY_DN29202_c0_g1_i1.p1 TRINITY_DN29202_c0_g1~~TRINITY_DN29202_c0_g1_i1.p1  ORF type:complete len:834 (+),score=80.47 TRINITY_DN29202_c0_g1_i1:47-2548(+)